MSLPNRIVGTASFLSVFAAGAAAAQAADVRAYYHFSGAFHPAVAHFPIALLVVAGVVELWRAIRGKKVPGDAGYTCLMLGAAGAVVAAVLGWANADHSGDFNGKQAEVLFFHRWLGVGVAVGAVVLAYFATRARAAAEVSSLGRFGLVIGLLICSALVGLTGSLGGKLTFGIDYYETVYNETIGADPAEAKVPHEAPPPPIAAATVPPVPPVQSVQSKADQPDPLKSVTAVDPSLVDSPVKAGSEPAIDPPIIAADPAATLAKVSYVSHIKPLFTAHCAKCHSDGKKKGDYRMDTRQLAFEPGGSGEAPIVPGKSEDSLLVKVIEGKGEYKENMMPPKGTILSAQQVTLIRRWIDEGAVWDE